MARVACRRFTQREHLSGETELRGTRRLSLNGTGKPPGFTEFRLYVESERRESSR